MPRALNEQEIAEALRPLSGWTCQDGRIALTREFETYAAGVLFANVAAALAETMDHHPDLAIGYRRVTVSLFTHSVGGVTDLDLEYARRLAALGL
ncbi:MAG: 4a-hydroxytetrahydrobiopterin dehydratase [Fimbriimonadaceae bacterium]